MAGPSWLTVTVKLKNRDSAYLSNKLFGKIAGTVAAGTALGGKFMLRRPAANIANLIAGIISGVYEGNVWVRGENDAGVRATGNIACTQANSAGDTITFTFGGATIVLTEGASGAQGFARGASNTTNAAALAACINAHPILGTLLVATPSVGNCALAGKLPGSTLNALTMTTSDGTAYTFTQLSGGTYGAVSIFPQHLSSAINP